MKKLFIICLLMFLSSCSGECGENYSFIYINGSNNNDNKMKTWYENGVTKLHKTLRNKFMKDKTLQTFFEDKGGYNINEKPVIFFWGYNSKDDLEFVIEKLKISKAVSSSGAYLMRSLITKFLHDAIWIQKPQHMLPVIDDLNKYVKKEAENGNKSVLYGYSAGTFVTYEYLFNKLPYIDLENFFEALNADKEFVEFVRKNPRKNTCISALTEKYGMIGTISQTGQFLLLTDKNLLKQNYLNIDEMTDIACSPEDSIRGVVNYASPLPLFYSDIADADFNTSYFNVFMAKYIMEHGIFMLTVNFREDPLGFPTSGNLSREEMEEMAGIVFKDPKGMIYDNSGVWSKRMFALAHTSYWSARGTFSKAIIKSLINGYKFQYNENYKNKILEKQPKHAELVTPAVKKN